MVELVIIFMDCICDSTLVYLCANIWIITVAGSGLISFTSGHTKSRGIILVELIERFPDVSVTALLWIFMLAKLTNKCSGKLTIATISTGAPVSLL